jgi:hypothetical protein
MKIICLSFCNGKKHDFKLFKESDVHAGENTEFETDTGYTCSYFNLTSSNRIQEFEIER